MPMDSHVWSAMLERYRSNMPKLTNIAKLKDCFIDDMEWFAAAFIVFSDIKAIIHVYHFAKDLDLNCIAAASRHSI